MRRAVTCGRRGPRQADLHRNCCNCSFGFFHSLATRPGLNGTGQSLPRLVRRERTKVHILVLSSQKGGTGKTTLSGHLAVEAQNAGVGPVALIDADPQGSLSHWWNARKASNHCSSRSVRSNWERR
jgi:Mrp family chromosome partitioning ATPase